VRADLDMALLRAPVLVAADGGANRLGDWGHLPQRIIGDLDSLTPEAQHRFAAQLEHVAEQDSTDFDKCLRMIDAPFVLALGFAGARLDHTLAGMRSVVRNGRARVLLVAEQDICFLAPPRLELSLPEGARVSLFPMAQVQGRSEGLVWPIEGLEFTPSGQIGTSNRALGGPVRLSFETPAMLVLLERAYLDAALGAVTTLPDWR
jgi:thiamine pyrophosphokinase